MKRRNFKIAGSLQKGLGKFARTLTSHAEKSRNRAEKMSGDNENQPHHQKESEKRALNHLPVRRKKGKVPTDLNTGGGGDSLRDVGRTGAVRCGNECPESTGNENRSEQAGKSSLTPEKSERETRGGKGVFNCRNTVKKLGTNRKRKKTLLVEGYQKKGGPFKWGDLSSLGRNAGRGLCREPRRGQHRQAASREGGYLFQCLKRKRTV